MQHQVDPKAKGAVQVRKLERYLDSVGFHVSKHLQAMGSVIVSLVTETAEEVGKLLRKENSFREISQKVNLGEIRPESAYSEEDRNERYLDEIDPRRSFREY